MSSQTLGKLRKLQSRKNLNKQRTLKLKLPFHHDSESCFCDGCGSMFSVLVEIIWIFNLSNLVFMYSFTHAWMYAFLR